MPRYRDASNPVRRRTLLQWGLIGGASGIAGCSNANSTKPTIDRKFARGVVDGQVVIRFEITPKSMAVPAEEMDVERLYPWEETPSRAEITEVTDTVYEIETDGPTYAGSVPIRIYSTFDGTTYETTVNANIAPAIFETDDYLGFYYGRGSYEDSEPSDLETIAEVLADEGVQTGLEEGTRAGVNALGERLGVKTATTKTASIIAAKIVVLGWTVMGMIPDANPPSRTTPYILTNRGGSVSLAREISASAGAGVYAAIHLQQGVELSEYVGLVLKESGSQKLLLDESLHWSERKLGNYLLIPHEPIMLPTELPVERAFSLYSRYYGTLSPPATISIKREPAETQTPDPEEETTESSEGDALFFEGFEDGTLSGWDVHNDGTWELDDEDAFEGKYSAHLGSTGFSGVATEKTVFESGEKIDRFTVIWKETENQGGFGIHLYDSDDRYVIGAGSGNPQWRVIPDEVPAGNHLRPFPFYNGDGYDRWIRFTFSFDWDEEIVVLEGQDSQSHSKATTEHELRRSTNISTIKIGHHHLPARKKRNNDMWFDSLEMFG